MDRDMSNGVRILVVTGVSAGHIYPALSFLDNLKDKYENIETLLAVPLRSLKTPIVSPGFKVKYLSFTTITLSVNLKNFSAILKFFKGSLESLILLLEFRPDIVVGFGGLDTLILVLLAWMFRIKTLIHEQNVIPGRANRLLARFVDKVAISFPETKNHLNISEQRIVLTGNPLRQYLNRVERQEALSFFGLDDDKFTILVMGGSSGSHKINMAFLEVLSGLPHTIKLQAIHIAGVLDYSPLADSYKGLKVKIKLFHFLQDMQYAYSTCDLVVCRAGATTIAELIKFHLPAVIVPYPFAYKHQLSNSKILEKLGTAIIINDEELDGPTLRNTLDDLINNPERLRSMRARYDAREELNASDLLVEEASSLGSLCKD